MSKQQPRKAVALISGGLDSMLAARVIQEQGIHVEGLNFFTGFCVEGHTHAIRNADKKKNKRNNALWVAETLGLKLHIIDVVEEYKEVLINPKYGYGQHMNPCLDCKVFMVKKALQWMEENEFDFIITGEVIGQRPMSQRKSTMPLVQKRSGAQERLLRPLCAKNLPPTYPEQQGWIDREHLHDFSGRSRKPQMALAEQFGFDEYAQPAGGCCFLTNEAYSAKLVDLWQAQDKKDYELDDLMLLKVGRHIRPKPYYKLIVSRDQGEGQFMEGYRKQFSHLRLTSHNGPFTLIDGSLKDADDIEQAARIVARYSNAAEGESVTLDYYPNSGQEEKQTIAVTPFQVEDIPKAWWV